MNKELKMLVEIPKGSINKYEYNEETQQWELDRVLAGSIIYPEEYGSIPNTLADDGDPLDVICITNFPTFAGCYVPIRIVGLMEMEDEGKKDDKIIAVNDADPRLKYIKSVYDLPKAKQDEITNFFFSYKKLEGKKVIIGSDFGNDMDAEKLIKECQNKWHNNNKKHGK